MVEAWAARLMFAEGQLLERAQAAKRWYEEEFAPVIELIQQGNLMEKGETPADAYMRAATERYSVFRDHAWSPDVIELARQRH